MLRTVCCVALFATLFVNDSQSLPVYKVKPKKDTSHNMKNQAIGKFNEFKDAAIHGGSHGAVNYIKKEAVKEAKH